jgi:hypothetical protein
MHAIEVPDGQGAGAGNARMVETSEDPHRQLDTFLIAGRARLSNLADTVWQLKQVILSTLSDHCSLPFQEAFLEGLEAVRTGAPAVLDLA